jgi:hypothetical protein
MFLYTQFPSFVVDIKETMKGDNTPGSLRHCFVYI